MKEEKKYSQKDLKQAFIEGYFYGVGDSEDYDYDPVEMSKEAYEDWITIGQLPC